VFVFLVLYFRGLSVNVMVGQMFMILLGIMVFQCLCSPEVLLTIGRGLWSSSCWSGFNLAPRCGVEAGMGFSWNAAVLIVVRLWKKEGIRLPEWKGGDGTGSSVVEDMGTPPANVSYLARSNLTRLVDIMAR
jgi:hypothetical protein